MKRVRIMFINCPILAVDATSYLLLSQNKVQKSIEFEVVHHWIYGNTIQPKKSLSEKTAWWLSEQLPRADFINRWICKKLDLRAAPLFRTQLTHTGWFGVVKNAVENYDRWFAKCGYNKFDTTPQPTIVITETPFEGGYLGYSQEDIAVVSLAKWEKFFKPGSALEYILGSVQRYSLRLIYKNIGSHYATRGCIWDFDVHQPDNRIAAYMGIMCETCRNSLSSTASSIELEDVEKLITNEWIGSNDTPTSSSANLRKIFRYSLRRSTGLHPGIIESLSQGMRTELGKFFLDILKVLLAALGTLYIASKFPDAYRILNGR